MLRLLKRWYQEVYPVTQRRKNGEVPNLPDGILTWKIMLPHRQIQHEHLQNLKIPLHPFLGCVGIAPENTKKIPTGIQVPLAAILILNS